MSTFHPATSSLANFKNTISTISTTGFFVYISCSHQDKNLRHSSHSLGIPWRTPTQHAEATPESLNSVCIVAHYRDNTLYATSKHFGLNTKTILSSFPALFTCQLHYSFAVMYTCYRGHHGFGGVINFSFRY